MTNCPDVDGNRPIADPSKPPHRLFYNLDTDHFWAWGFFFGPLKRGQR